MSTNNHDWLTSREFAERCGIHTKAASRILKRASDGQPWKGRDLVVREVDGVGGRGKVRQVLADSLAPPPVPASLSKCEHVHTLPSDRAERRHDIIRDACEHPPGSPARRLAVLRAANRSDVDLATIYRWIAKYEGRKAGSLSDAQGVKPGHGKVHISRNWDRAAREGGLDDGTMAEIAARLRADRNFQWEDRGLEIGWFRIANDSRDGLRDKLKMLTVEAGWQGDLTELHRVCELTRHFVREGRQEHRLVALYERDRKTYKDTVEYHAWRDWSLLEPMDWLSLDVHPHDFMLERPDGRKFTTKFIGALDCGTGRLKMKPVFHKPGGSVTQQHVAAFMAELMADPLWGIPMRAQRDRGKEFLAIDGIKKLLSTVYEARTGRAGPEISENRRNHGITISLPYNGQSKPIEPAFRRFERIVSEHPLHIAGDRMNKRTQNAGRQAVPYEGTKQEFLALCEHWTDTYNSLPFQSGPFAGKSPNEVYNTYVRDGWEPITANIEQLLGVFRKRKPKYRTAKQGRVEWKKKWYRLPEGVDGAGKVEIYPMVWETDVIAVMCNDGELRPALPDVKTDPRDLDEADRVREGEKVARRNRIAAQEKAAPIDPATVPAHLVTGADAPLKADVEGAAVVTGILAEMGKAIAGSPKQRKAEKADEERRIRDGSGKQSELLRMMMKTPAEETREKVLVEDGGGKHEDS
ncbi:MAG: hypothetical protein OXF88_02940 [Rhodobacteraceae bacterium]|nr:hypothetical protein [Paracoccaceae bacterium]